MFVISTRPEIPPLRLQVCAEICLYPWQKYRIE
jgi:hypothetical protein